MNLTKTAPRIYEAVYPSDIDEDVKIRTGDEVKATIARNPDFHRKCMALFHLGFNNQDEFSSFTIYRYSITMKAGFVIYHNGQAFPESLSFDSMGQARFEEVFKAVRDTIAKSIQIEGSQLETELAAYY